MPTEKQRSSLRRFIDGPPSPPPPVFVGRNDVILGVEGATASLITDGGGTGGYGKSKLTRILQGAPGAGKSSILRELERRSVEHGKTVSRLHNVLVLNSQNLRNMPKVMERMAVAAGLSSPEWRDRLLGTALKVGRNVGDAVSSQLSAVMQAGDAVRSFIRGIGGRPGDMYDLESIFPPRRWKTPLIVAVDEAQRLDWPVNSEQGAFLQCLHDGDPGFPILPVLAGLGDTRDVVQAAGLSRPEFNHEVGCLTPEERGEYLWRLRVEFGLLSRDDDAEVRENLHRLMDDTEGWPRHMHHAFQALGDCAHLAGWNLSRVDWSAVHGGAERRRRTYYRSQQSPEMESSVCLTGAVLDGLTDGMKMAGVDSLIRSGVRDGDGWRLPKGMDVEDLRQHLVHRGALRKKLDKTYDSPIPGFRRFLSDEGRKIQHDR